MLGQGDEQGPVPGHGNDETRCSPAQAGSLENSLGIPATTSETTSRHKEEIGMGGNVCLVMRGALRAKYKKVKK